MIIDWLMEKIDRWSSPSPPQMGFIYDIELRPRFKWPVSDHLDVTFIPAAWPVGRPFTTDPQH